MLTLRLEVENNTLFIIYFAKDQILIAEDKKDLSYKFRKLHEKYYLAGWNINMNKMESLKEVFNERQNLDIEGEYLEVVDE